MLLPVLAFILSVGCSDRPVTDPPAGLCEATIPATPPRGYLISDDSVAALYAKERQIWVHPRVAGPYPPDVVHITFHPSATQDEKQAALDLVCGRVIGGGWGAYYVLVPLDDSAQGAVWAAIDRLEALPQVLHADPDVTVGLGW